MARCQRPLSSLTTEDAVAYRASCVSPRRVSGGSVRHARARRRTGGHSPAHYRHARSLMRCRHDPEQARYLDRIHGVHAWCQWLGLRLFDVLDDFPGVLGFRYPSRKHKNHVALALRSEMLDRFRTTVGIEVTPFAKMSAYEALRISLFEETRIHSCNDDGEAAASILPAACRSMCRRGISSIEMNFISH